ncbi:aspartate-semialdehyde dehydrogenase [Candidatus Marinamargulisbacteria bacterium SCGC AG-343-D04]|nr:aspartate-semialdehyde dehydrogenase [Candidatus Marinamargulisbacteria bacterium SCGC AG-343-D04]
MSKKYNVAIVGATGVVGKEIINILEQRNFPIQSLTLLASKRSAGQVISFNEKAVKVKVLEENSFKDIDFALFSAGSSISEKFAPIAAKSGAIAIDNTSFFRMQDDIPLIVPEVNGHAIKNHKGIIANPNCSTAQLVMALKPIHDAATIKRLVISTYQSVSGAGKDAILELENHSRYLLKGEDSEPKEFVKPIPFNVIPQIDNFVDNGYTKEEMKMINETNKILESEINITATAVRVPVFISHCESVNIQTEKELSTKKVRDILSTFPGVTVLDDPQKSTFPTARDSSGKDDVYVGRIRKDISQKNSIDCWIVADNLRKGAALNAVQIAEYMIANPSK